MNTQHTPGPWTQYEGEVRAPGHGLISRSYYGSPDGPGAANARLIAAAPDLLEELKQMIRAYVRLMDNGRNRIRDLGGDCDPIEKMEANDPNLRTAKAAIAKATGEQP